MIKPILFNTGMVRAILEDKKTVTRRIVKQPVWENFVCEGGKVLHWLDKKADSLKNPAHKAPCHPGDILYVRETWAFKCCIECMDMEDEVECMLEKIPMVHEDKDSVSEGCYIYRADYPCPERIIWRPSIHMPKAAARIWLKVTDVRVERLQDITEEQAIKEGISCVKYDVNTEKEESAALDWFPVLWDSTVKKSDSDRYGWDANPWVWVIEFERCEKPESER